MIILSDTTQSLQITVTGAITTPLEIISSYVDIDSASNVVSGEQTATSSDADIVSAPAASTSRHVKFISIYNKDNVSHVVSVKKVISAVAKILVKITIEVGETLQYADGEGFNLMMGDGNRQTHEVPMIVFSAGTNSATSGTIIFSASNRVQFGMSGSSAVTMAVAPNTASYWASPNGKLYANSAAASTGGTESVNLSLQRLYLPYHMTVSRVDLLASMTMGGSTSGTWSAIVGLYTRSASTLNLASSTFSSLGWLSGTTTNSSQYYGANSNLRFRSFSAANWALTPGEYWFANMWIVTNVVGSSIGVSVLGSRQLNIIGPPTTINDTVGIGAVYSTTTGALPNSITFSQVIFASNDANGAYPTRQPTVSMYGSF